MDMSVKHWFMTGSRAGEEDEAGKENSAKIFNALLKCGLSQQYRIPVSRKHRGVYITRRFFYNQSKDLQQAPWEKS